MIIYLVADPLENSYITSLIEEYKRIGHTVYCGSKNFLVSNLVPDVLHIQWPEKIYNNYNSTALSEDEKIKKIEEKLLWFKDNNTIIIHTIHNLRPHNPVNLTFEKKIYNLTIKYSDLLIHHCQKSIELLNSIYNDSKDKINIVNQHPDYLYDYVEIDKYEARKKLGLPENAFIILNFGSQQKYKGGDFIESVFNKLPIKNKFLLTAGNYSYSSYSNQLFLKLRNLYRQKLRFKNKKYIYNKISSYDLPYILCSSDILFLAHQKSSLNSGILPLSATYNKPVVFPNIGCFNEQMKDWVFKNFIGGDKLSAISSITSLYKDIQGNKLNFDNSLWLNEHSWQKHVSKIMENIKK